MKTALRIKSLYLVKSAVLLGLFFAFGLSGLPLHADTEGARVVKYSQNDIVPVKAKLRFSTLIILPENEEILDFTTGDKEFWIINGAHNVCYIHPAQAGIRSNLNLITASGHVYSFLLTEISSDPNSDPDLKIFIEPKEESGIGTGAFAQDYVPANEAAAYKQEIQTVRDQASAQVQAAQANAQQQIQKFRSDYATKLQFDYRFDSKGDAQPFLVSAIYHDDAFTYIKCAASEKPAIYEVKDGKPSLINFDLLNGVYIVPKIVDTGYLAIGKKKLAFSRHQ
jgi:type IV secretion system protein VirB9